MQTFTEPCWEWSTELARLYVQAQEKNIENLRNKLIAGKNEQSGGYQKFATAQFYGKYHTYWLYISGYNIAFSSCL